MPGALKEIKCPVGGVGGQKNRVENLGSVVRRLAYL